MPNISVGRGLRTADPYDVADARTYAGAGYSFDDRFPQKFAPQSVMLLDPDLVRVHASWFADLPSLPINDTTSATGWVGTALANPQTITVDTTTYGVSCIAVTQFRPSSSKVWLNLPEPLEVGTFSHVRFDVRFASITGNTVPSNAIAVASSGMSGSGVRSVADDLPRQIPNASAAAWTTVFVPLTGITSLRSIGVETLGGTFATDRSTMFIRDIRFAAATGIDQAIHAASPTGEVVVPAGYTSAYSQRSWLDKPAGVTVVDMRPGRQHTTGQDGYVWADDYLIDPTGVADVAGDLSWLLNRIAQEGDTVRLHAGGHYRLATAPPTKPMVEVTRNRIRIEGRGATLFAGVANFDRSLLSLPCRSVSVDDLSVVGEFTQTFTGAALKSVGGAPVVADTSVVLDGQGDTVRPSMFGTDVPFVWGRDRFDRCKVTFTASASAPVASDLVVEVLNPYTLAVMHSQAFTLTGTPAVYAFEWTPADIELAVFLNIRKATATASTITIDQLDAFRPQGYVGDREFNAAFLVSGARDVTLTNCRGESIGGDAIQASAFASGVTVDGFISRAAGRQGVSFNWGERFILRNVNIIGPGRSGIDVEPYVAGWVVRDVVIENWRLSWTRNWPLLCQNWGATYDVSIRNVQIIENGRTPFSFGARRLFVDNVTATSPLFHPDGVTLGGFTGNECGMFFGQDVHVGHIETGAGWMTVALPHSDQDETGATVSGNDISVVAARRSVTVPYAATIAPHHTRLHASDIFVGTLTGNLTVANPPAENQYHQHGVMWRGFTVAFHFTQDATGGRTVTWGSKYRNAPAIAVEAGARSVVRFVYDGVDYWAT